MKKTIVSFSIMLVAALAFMFSSCKKDNTANTEDDSVSASDVASVSTAMDITSDDAANAAGQVKSFSGKTAGWWNGAVLCGVATVDTTATLISVIYDGSTTCSGIVRTGSISVVNNSGILWKNQNSVLTVTYNNLKFTDVVTGGSFTVNGTHTITNVTGGLAWEVVAGITQGTVTHNVSSTNMSITFPNGQTRTWTVNRNRSWNLNGAVVTDSVSAGGANNVTISGTNRFGNTFTNQITQTVAANTTCNLWAPYQGTFTHMVNGRTTTVLFGTNSSGIQAVYPACGAGYFITYNNGGGQLTKFVGYWQ